MLPRRHRKGRAQRAREPEGLRREAGSRRVGRGSSLPGKRHPIHTQGGLSALTAQRKPTCCLHLATPTAFGHAHSGQAQGQEPETIPQTLREKRPCQESRAPG